MRQQRKGAFMRMSRRLRLPAAVACCVLAAGCSSAPAGGGGDGGTTVTLDAGGMVQSNVTVLGPAGSTLTLFAGSTVEVIAPGQLPAPPAVGAPVTLAWAAASRSDYTLPTGVASLGALRVVLRVAGQEVEGRFWPSAPRGSAPASGAIDDGLKLVVQLADGVVDDGTLGILFEVPSSGTPLRVATSEVFGDPWMAFNLTASGDAAVGGLPAPAPPPSVPPGLSWSTVHVTDPGCVTVGATEVCGPSEVDRVAVVEKSTAEILGFCFFQGSDRAATSPSPAGEQFYCERSAAGDGWDITISSPQSNLPLVHAYVVRSSDRLPMWEAYEGPASPLHTPGGATLTDPYADPALQFAVYKELHFTAPPGRTEAFMKEKALQPLLDAGYAARIRRFRSSTSGVSAEIGVYETLDGRARMEAEVIQKNGWKVVSGPDATHGNVGTYEYVGKLSVSTLGIMLKPDYRILGEQPVEGDVLVHLDDQVISTARLTVNGLEVALGLGDMYDVATAGVSIGPGDTVTLVASLPSGPAPVTFSFQCPPDFAITSPADGSPISAPPLTVTWTPGVPVVPAFTFFPVPVAGQFACDIGTGGYSRFGTGEWFVDLAQGQTQATLTDVDPACDASIIEVRTSSELAWDLDGNMALCLLHRRVRQIAPP